MTRSRIDELYNSNNIKPQPPDPILTAIHHLTQAVEKQTEAIAMLAELILPTSQTPQPQQPEQAPKQTQKPAPRSRKRHK